jgi:uncharacterized protein DUF1918
MNRPLRADRVPEVRAAIGDRIVVRGHHVGAHERSGVVLAVEGENGGPPYLVRWDEGGHESLFFPGSDSTVEHYPVPVPQG